MHDDPVMNWVFKHFGKIWAGMVIIILTVFLLQVAIALFVGHEIADKGLKSVIESVWEGPAKE